MIPFQQLTRGVEPRSFIITKCCSLGAFVFVSEGKSMPDSIRHNNKTVYWTFLHDHRSWNYIIRSHATKRKKAKKRRKSWHFIANVALDFQRAFGTEHKVWWCYGGRCGCVLKSVSCWQAGSQVNESIKEGEHSKISMRNQFTQHTLPHTEIINQWKKTSGLWCTNCASGYGSIQQRCALADLICASLFFL